MHLFNFITKSIIRSYYQVSQSSTCIICLIHATTKDDNNLIYRNDHKNTTLKVHISIIE